MNKDLSLLNSEVLVVGGAGFVGSNLCIQLLNQGVSKLIIVDNLLSSTISNIPDDSRIVFINGSIADDTVLKLLPKSLDFV